MFTLDGSLHNFISLSFISKLNESLVFMMNRVCLCPFISHVSCSTVTDHITSLCYFYLVSGVKQTTKSGWLSKVYIYLPRDYHHVWRPRAGIYLKRMQGSVYSTWLL